MSTAAQITANRANSQLSTGPVTPAGREISSRNNLRHGFRSQTVLLPGDDVAEYESLLFELTEHFDPSDLTETRLVREMADAEWCLRRVRAHHESALTRQIAVLAARLPDADPAELPSRAIETLAETGTSHATWLRYESKFERQYQQANREWGNYQLALAKTAPKAAADELIHALLAPLPGEKEDELASNVPLAANTPRSGACPCGSGAKYKRCCGRHAPPVLGAPASLAA